MMFSPGRGDAMRAVLMQLVRLIFDACTALLNRNKATPLELVVVHSSSVHEP